MAMRHPDERDLALDTLAFVRALHHKEAEDAAEIVMVYKDECLKLMVPLGQLVVDLLERTGNDVDKVLDSYVKQVLKREEN